MTRIKSVGRKIDLRTVGPADYLPKSNVGDEGGDSLLRRVMFRKQDSNVVVAYPILISSNAIPAVMVVAGLGSMVGAES